MLMFLSTSEGHTEPCFWCHLVGCVYVCFDMMIENYNEYPRPHPHKYIHTHPPTHLKAVEEGDPEAVEAAEGHVPGHRQRIPFV